ncbi:hypothetical protein ACFXA8_36735, partial [Streptomyces sp. NPDC059409]
MPAGAGAPVAHRARRSPPTPYAGACGLSATSVVVESSPSSSPAPQKAARAPPPANSPSHADHHVPDPPRA